MTVAAHNASSANPPSVAQAAAGLARLGFIAGGEHWWVDAACGVQVIDAAVTPVPLTRRWYLGLVRYRQKLHGAIDLAGLRGAEVAALRPTERLLVLHERWRTALRVDRVHGLMEAASANDEDADGMRWQWLDIRRLCTSPTFLHAGLSSSI